jgi:hypothetical protein
MSDLIPARHEPKDVNVPGLLIAAGILAVTVAVAFVAAWWLFDYLSARDRERKPSAFPLAAEERGRLPPEPRLEEIDRLEGKKADMRPGQLRAAQQRRLETYGWVDETAGIVRIPIDRAMKVLVEQKRLPARPEEARGQDGEAGATRPSAANSGRPVRREQP